MLRISNLSKTYKKGNIPIPALRDVSLEVIQGEFVSIVGRSGSGMKRFDLAQHRRFAVGMVFQSFNLIPYRSALDNVVLALTFGVIPRPKRKFIAEGLLSQVGLEHRLHHKPSELSGGEAQRVAIARALANNPAVLLADEPTGNLDSLTSEEIIGLIRNLNRDHGLTVLMVTHEQETAKSVSHKVIHLLDGKIVHHLKSLKQGKTA